MAFHRRVRDGFLALAAAEPARFTVIDGRQTAEVVEAAILEAVLARLAAKAELTAVNAGRRAEGSATAPSEPDRGSLRMNR